MSRRVSRRGPVSIRRGRGPRGQGGFTLAEVLVALSLVASVGVVASGAAQSFLRFARAARSEAAGLAAASARLEEMLALASSRRENGNDELVVDGLRITRTWRLERDVPESGLTRVEVTARWEHPEITLLTLVGVAP